MQHGHRLAHESLVSGKDHAPFADLASDIRQKSPARAADEREACHRVPRPHVAFEISINPACGDVGEHRRARPNLPEAETCTQQTCRITAKDSDRNPADVTYADGRASRIGFAGDAQGHAVTAR